MQIGGYRIDGKLGEGGMGEVFVGTHELMGKRVAIKVLRHEHSQNADVVNRFFKEARASTLLNHPGCVDVIDTGRLDDGRGYIIMALLEGQSLKDRLAGGRLQPRIQMAIARQIADVLSVAHQKGIIHRDLKPENLFLEADAADPSGIRVKVLDFGVAKLSEGGPRLMTNPNAIIGTPAYMSPEQCKGAAFADSQSDIYSLGCIMFEMACGQPPFVGSGFGDYLMAHIATPVPAPSTFGPIDPEYERIILQALSKAKEQRQKTMAELMGQLDALTLPRSAPDAATLVGDTLSRDAVLKAAERIQKEKQQEQKTRPPASARAAAGARSPAIWIALGVVVVVAAGAAWFFLLR